MQTENTINVLYGLRPEPAGVHELGHVGEPCADVARSIAMSFFGPKVGSSRSRPWIS
jgi:hypothetical protein